jgi:hypothetical protein
VQFAAKAGTEALRIVREHCLPVVATSAAAFARACGSGEELALTIFEAFKLTNGFPTPLEANSVVDRRDLL